ncbi:MAG TPA: hypothetical protein VMG37_13110 [Solirubrobacteraceae bacterium]|nr:hypothetical protein [Solirubrobacteraceae bacterium]
MSEATLAPEAAIADAGVATPVAGAALRQERPPSHDAIPDFSEVLVPCFGCSSVLNRVRALVMHSHLTVLHSVFTSSPAESDLRVVLVMRADGGSRGILPGDP